VSVVPLSDRTGASGGVRDAAEAWLPRRTGGGPSFRAAAHAVVAATSPTKRHQPWAESGAGSGVEKHGGAPVPVPGGRSAAAAHALMADWRPPAPGAAPPGVRRGSGASAAGHAARAAAVAMLGGYPPHGHAQARRGSNSSAAGASEPHHTGRSSSLLDPHPGTGRHTGRALSDAGGGTDTGRSGWDGGGGGGLGGLIQPMYEHGAGGVGGGGGGDSTDRLQVGREAPAAHAGWYASDI
jgi:hypothetical protein